ncbi:MAG: short-chain dehydrogenase [Alteromonadaceae bacterium]|nr:MAG: short-chain dehydrogenase [Alteromonadaceae bacterium]
MKEIANQTIDILINNAGILRDESFDSLNYEQIIEQFQVNTLGPIRVVEALFNNLKSGSKIALITSRMGSIDDNDSGGRYGYRMSKCALNAAGKSMAVDFKSKGISVALLHPGFVKTEMVNFGGLITAEESANNLAQRIEELSLENTGTFWHSNGEVLPW